MIEICTAILDEENWGELDIEALAKTAIELIDNHHETVDDREISVVFTNNDTVQGLNKMYRGKDEPTNVLSFAFNDDGSDGPMLGELFIAYDVILKEAKEQGKGVDAHLMHILIHGMLHLLGYDHEDDTDAKEMEKLEIELLHKIDVFL